MQNRRFRVKPSIASHWKTTLSFIGIATFLILLFGWLVTQGVLPFKTILEYSNFGLKFIRVWLRIAIFIGIVLPATAFLIWIRNREVRKVFGFYLFVAIAQIATEGILSSLWFGSIVVPIGTLYTAFRIGQLWQGQRAIDTTPQLTPMSRTSIEGLLWILLIFWSLNLIMLFVLSWPRIL